MQEKQAAHEAEQLRLLNERAELERLRAEAEERERAAAAERAEAERKAKLARDREEAERRERDVRERAERQRIDNIRERIAAIKATVAMQAGKPSASIESAISALQAMDMSGFDEFFDEAEQARHDATVNLGEMVASVRAMEQAQAEIARQQAELAAAKAEQERVEREAREAAEAKAKAEALEAAHIEAIAENARIDAERAAIKKKIDDERAAEIERARRAQEEFEKNGPGDVEMVKVLAEHYDVTVGDVMQWMKKFDYSAADEQLAAENVKANRLEAA
jgi:chromosome segregation ATPase